MLDLRVEGSEGETVKERAKGDAAGTWKSINSTHTNTHTHKK